MEPLDSTRQPSVGGVDNRASFLRIFAPEAGVTTHRAGEEMWGGLPLSGVHPTPGTEAGDRPARWSYWKKPAALRSVVR